MTLPVLEPAVGTFGFSFQASLQRFQLALTRDKESWVLDQLTIRSGGVIGETESDRAWAS